MSENKKVYVVQWFWIDGDARGSEILPVGYSTAEDARRAVENRRGIHPIAWSEHNSHGKCWTTADGKYAVNEVEISEESVR